MGRRLKNKLQYSLHDVFDVFWNGGNVMFIALFFAGEKRHLGQVIRVLLELQRHEVGNFGMYLIPEYHGM